MAYLNLDFGFVVVVGFSAFGVAAIGVAFNFGVTALSVLGIAV